MKRGEIIREWDAENYEKAFEINRLLMKTGGPKGIRPKPKPRAWIKAHRLFAVAMVLLAVSGIAYGYAALTIFVPQVPAHGILANCPAQSIPSNSAVVINQTGFVLVTCGGSSGLFQILAGTRAVANYSLPRPYLDLYAYPAGQDSVIQTRCTDAPAAVNLNSAWTSGFRGNYSLCLDYGPAGANGLPGFPISWTVT